MSYLANFHHQFMGNENSSKKLVFLHGLMGYGANWRTVAKAFEEDYHILYYDQRGHGRSISPPTGYRPEDFADDLLKILDELGWQQIYLVGHSMGGRVVANFAARFPERVHQLVIEDIGPDKNQGAIDRIEALLDGIPATFDSKKDAKEYFMNDFPKQFADRLNVRALGQFLYSNFGDREDGKVSWKFDPEVMRQCVLEGRSVDRYDQWATIKVQTLLLRGSKTEEMAKEVYLRVLNENKNIRGIEIKEAGHWLHYEKVDEFIASLKDFFA